MIDELRAEVHKLKGKVDELDTEIEFQVGKIAQLERKADQLEEEVAFRDQRVDQLERKSQMLEAEVDQLKVRVARDEELEKLKQDIGTLKEELIAQRPPSQHPRQHHRRGQPRRRRDPRLLTRPVLDRESARCVAAGSR